MVEQAGPNEAFVQWVRNALAHLYDYPYLQTHPLAGRCQEGGDARSRAQALRRILLECLDQLAPQQETTAPAEANRAYAVLTYHYLDGLTMPEVAQQLALSQRQAYREHEKGIKALASLLWDRLGAEQTALAPQDETSTPQATAAQEEVERLLQGASYEALDLAVAAQAALQLVAPLAQKHGMRGVVHASKSPLHVWADRTLVRQILINLLGHALDCGCRGELQVEIAAQDHEVAVTLQGERGEEAGPEQEVPDGPRQINLAIAQRLAEAQGGRLELSLGARWEARLILPAANRATLLVIDDNADLITLVQRYLGEYPVAVVGCLDGRQALQMADEQRPELILLDLMMPSFDGWDLLQQLKASPVTGNIPVIICSVLSQVEMARSLGANDYLVKPISQTELLRVLRRWLALPLSSEPAPPATPPPPE